MSTEQTPRRFGRRKVLTASLGLAGAAAVAGGVTYALTRPEETARTGLRVTKVADLTGGKHTSRFGIGGTDLGIPVTTPQGRRLFIFGDTYQGDSPDEAETKADTWRSPVGLFSTDGDLAQGIKWDEAIGGDHARQLWDYKHNNSDFSTVLPSDVVTIGDTMYLHVMVHKGLANVLRSQIWKSSDEGKTWEQTAAEWPGDLYGGRMQLWTWAAGDDGYVYVYSTRFDRTEGILLHRVPTDKLEDSGAYQWWGREGDNWDWGIGKPEKSLIWQRRTGEMCLRPMEGKWVLTWFNEQDYSIDGIILDSPTDKLKVSDRQQLIRGADWGEEDDSHVAQLYGGYIIPGSTIDDLHLTVSQWNTDKNTDYHVMQHRVQGLAD